MLYPADTMRRITLVLVALSLASCLGESPEGLAPAPEAKTTVKMDFLHRPLPEIPLPNDIATRYDATSATGRRVNASLVAPTQFEARFRELLAQQDGWGRLQPISIPFTGPIDPTSVMAGHSDDNYDPADDVVYLVDITPSSPAYGELTMLDIGNGNYPVTLEERDLYWRNDPRGDTMSLLYEEVDEDTNGNGVLDRGEDSDADGVLDKPNWLPGHNPAPEDLAGRSDAIMTFYEAETQTLIVKPMVPLRERTTYAVVVTRRILDMDGEPVGSPYDFINHNGQTEALQPLLKVMPAGLALSDVAFTWTFTTQSLESHWVAVRNGLYGEGVQKHLGEDFPADVGGLLRLRDAAAFPDAKNLHILPAETWIPAYEILAQTLLGGDTSSLEYRTLLEHNWYVDYQVIGWFESPQLFPREGDDGEWVGFNDQSWPPDLDRVPAPARSEKIYFHLTVPRKEVSARGKGAPAPVVLLGHGYTGNRFDAVTFGPYLARYGLAVLAIDNVSHGISVSPLEKSLAGNLFGGQGIGGFAEAVFTDRAHDQNGDGVVDSGADFWTAYLFHTRDVVRQTALDYMQVVRILRGFDGERRFNFDVDGDGVNELAGDFDGDGQVDIGGRASITMTGGSLGGMMATVMGGLEPELDAIVPIVPGGGVAEIGIRSRQGGVPEAFILRSMSPIYIGTVDAEAGGLVVETIVPDLNDLAELPFAVVPDVQPGDTFLAENLTNGERGCGYVGAEGTVRASVESDEGDRTRILLFRGDALVLGSTECETMEDAEPMAVVDTFERSVDFQQVTKEAGEPLVALAEGLGLRRANPEFRRLQGIAQMVLDPGDPAIYATHMLGEPIIYARGKRTRTHALILPSAGDMSVPVSSSMTIARAAGLLEYQVSNPLYGKPDNQVLIDNYVAEAVNTLKRFESPEGEGVHIDVLNFGDNEDRWTWAPRLDPPLRVGFDKTDAHGGRSAYLVVYQRPTGQHGFPPPGSDTDRFRRECGEDCERTLGFDTGFFFVEMMGKYLASGGKVLRNDVCQRTGTCSDKPPVPGPRQNQ